MTSRILVESDPHQTGIAVMEDDRLTEVFIERHRDRSLVGNLYKGRVNRVLPGMQAAFVDIGLERDAFLYVSDVLSQDDALEAEVDLDDTHLGGLPPDPPSIDELLKPGEELFVQVVKAPLPNKGARITTQITLPGRYLVLLPTVRHLGVSRRIEDEAERERLLEVLAELAPPAGGLIVRTVGEGQGAEEFRPDREYLWSLWQALETKAKGVKAPGLVHQDLDLALRVVRDIFRPEYEQLLVDGEETYARIVEFLAQVQPALLPRVKPYSGEEPLFDRFGIQNQIEAALKSRVWLKSGGYIVINQTEALVAIDVNTGRYVGRDNLEETVLKTNLEAVKEVVRQIRLRDLGGILVVDLIDMAVEEHRQQVFALLEQELAKDRAKNKVLSISEFGLVEITRKRSRTNLQRLLTQQCSHCRGSGRVKSLATICLALRRDVLRWRGRSIEGGLTLRVHPEVARALRQEEKGVFSEMAAEMGVEIFLEPDPEIALERFYVMEV